MSSTPPPDQVERRDPLVLRIVDRVTAIAAIGSAVALWALLINVAIDVLARALSGRPLGLTLELTTYWWMPIIVALSYALTEQRGDHITVTILLDRLSPSMRRRVDGTFSAIGAGLVGLLTWFAAVAAVDAAEVRLIANSNPPLEYWQVKFIVLIGLALLAIQLAARSFRQFWGRGASTHDLEDEGAEL